MNARVLRESIHHDQPVVSLEVDGMVDMDTLPWSVRHYPWMDRLLGRHVLVFGAGDTTSRGMHDVSVDTWPVNSCSCQLFHPLYSEMTQVKNVKDTSLQVLGNDNPTTVKYAVMRYGQIIFDVSE